MHSHSEYQLTCKHQNESENVLECTVDVFTSRHMNFDSSTCACDTAECTPRRPQALYSSRHSSRHSDAGGTPPSKRRRSRRDQRRTWAAPPAARPVVSHARPWRHRRREAYRALAPHAPPPPCASVDRVSAQRRHTCRKAGWTGGAKTKSGGRVGFGGAPLEPLETGSRLVVVRELW